MTNTNQNITRLCRAVLGEDWYIVDPVGVEQGNEIIINEIIKKYNPNFFIKEAACNYIEREFGRYHLFGTKIKIYKKRRVYKVVFKNISFDKYALYKNIYVYLDKNLQPKCWGIPSKCDLFFC